MANSTTTLSKPNFETFTKDTFRNLLDDEDLSDITLACDDGQLVKAHKVVLASASTFFKTILGQVPNPKPLIHIQGIKAFQLRLLLDYIYLGRASIEREDLGEFFETTRSLRIEGLEEVMEQERKNLMEQERKNLMEQERKNLMEEERKNLREENARDVADRRRMRKTQSHETGNPHPHPVKRLFLQLATRPNKPTEIQNPSTGTQQKEDNEQEKTQSAKGSESKVGVGVVDLLVCDLGKKKVEEAEVMDGISPSEIGRFSHQVGGDDGGGQVGGGEQVFDNKIKRPGIRSANPKVVHTPRCKRRERSLDKMEVESKEEALVRRETSHLEEKMLNEEHSGHDKSLILEKVTPENLEDDIIKEVLEEESDMASNVEDWGYAKSFPEAEEIVDPRSSGNALTDKMTGEGAEVVHKLLEEETKKKYNLRTRKNTFSEDRRLALNLFHDLNNGKRRQKERRRLSIAPSREKLNQKRANISGPLLRSTGLTVGALQVLNRFNFVLKIPE